MGSRSQLRAEADWQMRGSSCWQRQVLRSQRDAGRNKKASAPHASFKAALENAGNALCSSCLGSSSALPARSSHTDAQLVHIQGARRWHSRMHSYIVWACQPNKADDVSLWLLLYQLITLGKLWSGFCTLLALGMLIRYSSAVL